MAILKHIAVKNADYGEALRYLIYEHDEITGKPILDDNGEMQLRDEYYIDGINCSPLSFGDECQELNNRSNKNQSYDEIKAHHYVISFDPRDKEECGLTGERAQQLGLEYAAKNFPGHQALVCTHMDGQNGSGNIHVHIVINSLRKYDVERQDFMERPCAGLSLPPVLLMYLLRAKAHPDHLPTVPALHFKHRLARWHFLNVKDVPPAFRVRASDPFH